MTDLLASVLFATIIAATPIALAGLGELVTEKSGMLNLGAEGLMAVGAIAAFVGAFTFGSEWLGVLFGMAAGVALSMVFAFLTLQLLANQVATGLALAIFGTGFAAFAGKAYESQVLTPVAPWVIPWLSDLPILGKALFSHQPIVYISWLIFLAVAWILARSRIGLVLKAVGESPHNAHAVGLPVRRIRLLAIAFGGAMAGLGGGLSVGLLHTVLDRAYGGWARLDCPSLGSLCHLAASSALFWCTSVWGYSRGSVVCSVLQPSNRNSVSVTYSNALPCDHCCFSIYLW